MSSCKDCKTWYGLSALQVEHGAAERREEEMVVMRMAALIVGILFIALGTLGIATLLAPAPDLPIPDVSLQEVANIVFPIGGIVFVLLGIGLLGWLVFQRGNEENSRQKQS